MKNQFNKKRLMEVAGIKSLMKQKQNATLNEVAMSAMEAESMAVEILNHLMDNDIIERGFDEELATELIVLTLTGGPGGI